MKVIIVISIFFCLILQSCHHEWVLRPEIRGRTVNFEKVAVNSKVSTLPVEGEIEEIAKNEKDGEFIFPKITVKEWTFLGMEKPQGPPTTNKIIFRNKNFKIDTLDYTTYKSHDNIIDLGDIILINDRE